MKIDKRRLVAMIREELEASASAPNYSAAIGLSIDRVLTDRRVNDHFFALMQRILKLIDVNDALPASVYDEALTPGSSFQRGIFDAIVDDFTSLIEDA